MCKPLIKDTFYCSKTDLISGVNNEVDKTLNSLMQYHKKLNNALKLVRDKNYRAMVKQTRNATKFKNALKGIA